MSGTHWAKVADQFHNFGPPLRPCEQDVAIVNRLLAEHSCRSRSDVLRVLACGATPELTAVRWPAGVNYLAVEGLRQMIRAVWPHAVERQRWAACGDWLSFPLHDRSRDVVLGDGSFNGQQYPVGYEKLARSIRRVLRDDGLLIIRAFVRPNLIEKPEDVFADLTAGRIQRFHTFRLRLYMALQGARDGVLGGDLFSVWTAAAIDSEELASRMKWPEPVIKTMDLLESSDVCLSFPTLDGLRTVLRPFFEQVRVCVPDYELGDRCPLVAFRPV